MSRRPPGVTSTDTRVPYTALFRSSVRLLAECDDGIHDFAAERIGRGHIAHHLAGKGPERAHHIVRKLLQDHAVLTDKGVERTVVLGHELAHHEEIRIAVRSEEHTSELQSLMRISYAVFCLKKKK